MRFDSRTRLFSLFNTIARQIKIPLTSRAIKFLQNYAIYISFPISNIRRFANNDFNQIVHSEVFAYFRSGSVAKNKPRGYFRREWTRLAWMAMEGRYHESNQKRGELLQEARHLRGISENYVPQIMEKGWTTHFGHIGLLILFVQAQNLGLIPLPKRLLLKSQHFDKARPLFRSLLNDFDVMSLDSNVSIFDSEPLFPLTEKVSIVSQGESFIEIARLSNLVAEEYRRLGNVNRTKILFSETEIAGYNRLLRKYGIDLDRQLVVLHIRDSNDKYGIRDSSLTSFAPMVDYVFNNGGFVIRIGGNENRKMPPQRGLIDLSSSNIEDQILHEYAIMHCKYLVSSQSGPSELARILGIPTLQVDTVGIAKSTLSTRAPAMYLPKSLKDAKGKKLGWQSLLSPELAFREMPTSLGNFHLSQNDSSEILSAVKEFSESLEKDRNLYSNPTSFNRLKSEVKGFGDGVISQVFFAD